MECILRPLQSTRNYTAFCLLLLSTSVFAINTKTATTTGSWSNGSVWSPAGVPSDTDNVIINSGVVLTIDGDYTCRNLTVGSATASNATLKITTAGNSLICTGDLQINPSDKSNTYIIDAGPGDIYINGTFSKWSASGTNNFKIGTGSLTFIPSVTISNAGNSMLFTGAGTINFAANFTDQHDNITFFTGCNINFHSNYTVDGAAVDWGGKGIANFYGTGTITDNSDIIMNTVNIMAGSATTLAAGTATFTVKGNFTMNSGCTFYMGDNFDLMGNFTNNGGTVSAGSVTITFKGTSQTIDGTATLNLPNLQIGKTSGTTDCLVTMNRSTTCNNLVLSTTNKNRSLTLAGGVTLTVSGNLTLYQPSRNNRYSTLSVGPGSCTVSGNLIFSGTNSGITRICKVDAGSGSFTLGGNITWMSNNAVATEVITVSTGTVNFTGSVTMGTKSGTIGVTSTGTINFNGTSSPSLSFGGATAPVLSTASGSTVNFAKGITVSTNPLTFAVGSNQVFKGTATITPSAAITFGNFQINAACTVTAAGNFSVKGDWTNYGTFTPATYAVSFSGTGTQVITRSGGEIFYGFNAVTYGATLQQNNDVIITNSLSMSGANINANGNTLQLGNGSGAALNYTIGQVYGGVFKRYWPAAAISSTSGNYYGLFPVGTLVDYRPVTINSTVDPGGAGYVSVTHTDAITATNLTYTDNEGFIVQQIADKHSDISYTGITGGTYNLDVKLTDMGSQGSVSNLRMITYASGTPGSYGAHSTTTGSLSAPIGHRTGLSLANLAHNWVLGTNDRANTPMYVYVYSRASGNWNDASATGPWSYTPGGSGAACSCYPTSAGYAVIESGHTITLTANDTVKFIDINSGGALTINSLKSLRVNGSLDMYGTATFTNNGSLVVTNELLLSSPVSPTVNGNVTTNYFTMPSGTSYTQSSGNLTVTGELGLSGALSMASGAALVFNGAGSHLSGVGGTFTTASGGTFPISNNKIIEPGTSITIGTSGTNTTVSLAANTTVNNIGSIVVNGNITGANATTSLWINNANSALSASGSILTTGTLDVSTAPNIVEYSGSGAQTIKIPYTSYNILKAANGGTKTLAGDIIVDSLLIIGVSVILDESTNVISGDGGIAMSGTSELKLSRATDDYVYPELGGNYLLTGGTVTLNQTGDSCQIHAGTYYNLKLNGSTPYDLGAVAGVANNLDMSGSSTISDNSILTVGNTFTYASSGSSQLWDSIAVNGIVLTSGTLISNGESINVFGSGGWTKATSATFTPSTGTVYFTGVAAQTLGGTAATQYFNSICVNKSSNTVTLGGSLTTLSVAGDIMLEGGGFSNGTATAINMTGGNWTNNGGLFIPGSGTVTFSSTGADQAIQGLSSAETFNNVVLNKSGYALSVGGSMRTIALNGNMTLTAGTLNAGTADDFYLTAGNWINNGATFTPGSSRVTFNGTGAQAVQGTSATQIFNKLTVDKSAGTLSIAGSTTGLTLNSDLVLAAGVFDKGTASIIYAGGNWTNNGGTFTYGTGTVSFNGTTAQAINGSAAAQTFYNLTINKTTDTLSISGNTATVTVNNTLTFTSGLVKTGTAKVSIPTSATVSGAGTGKYIYGNEEMYIPNTAAPSKTFDIGDASTYAPVNVAFVGTVSGSGSVTGFTTTGDDADISNSGINSSKSVNRTWTLSNSGVAGFTSYSPTYNFAAGDVDGTATTANFIVRRYTGGTWYTTTTGTRTSTATQATGETTFGRSQVGEKNTITVATNPVDTSKCDGYSAVFNSTSSSIPAPSVIWQRDPNTGVFTDITAGMDGGVYSGYTGNTLTLTNVAGLSGYKYRAVFTNINGAATSATATLTANTTPTITSTTSDVRCDAGVLNLAATASGGTINWYSASSGGSSLNSGTSYSPNLAASATYYVDATAGACTTPARTAITAIVSTTPTANIAYQSCAGVDGETTIQIGHTGGTSPFTYKLNSGSFTSSDTVHIANGSNQNYYVKDTYGCTSSATNFTATSVVPTVIASTGSSSTCSCASAGEAREVYLTNTSGELIAVINDHGHNLGTITATTYMRANPVLITNTQGGQDAAMSRSFVLDFAGTNLVPSVEVKFPFTTTELNDLVAAAAGTANQSDDINSLTDLGSTQYEGPGEDDTYNTAGATMLVRHRQLGNGSILNGQFVKIALSANGEHWLHGNSSGSALPVKLVSFGAVANVATHQVETRWTTSLEINNDYFIVERSEDGLNFNQLGRLHGAGTTTATTDYRFNDVKPFDGLSYYRLKQVDFDGDFTYSDVVAVTLGVYGSFTLYPNPTQNEFTIDVSNASEKTEVSIFDLHGRQVYNHAYNQSTPSKSQLITIKAKDVLAAGMYMVHVSTNGTVFKQKLIIN